jgi:hypothetical protein
VDLKLASLLGDVGEFNFTFFAESLELFWSHNNDDDDELSLILLGESVDDEFNVIFTIFFRNVCVTSFSLLSLFRLVFSSCDAIFCSVLLLELSEIFFLE